LIFGTNFTSGIAKNRCSDLLFFLNIGFIIDYNCSYATKKGGTKVN